MHDEDVDFDENISSVLGANTGNARLESGASSRRGCTSHGYNYYHLALSMHFLYCYIIIKLMLLCEFSLPFSLSQG